MKRETPVNVAASVRARLLKVSKEHSEDFTLTLMMWPLRKPAYPATMIAFLLTPSDLSPSLKPTAYTYSM